MSVTKKKTFHFVETKKNKKETCINNCIDYLLHKKLLPCFDKNWLENTKVLVQKYYL